MTFSNMYMGGDRPSRLFNDLSLKLIGNSWWLVKLSECTFSTMYIVVGRFPQYVNGSLLKPIGKKGKLV